MAIHFAADSNAWDRVRLTYEAYGVIFAIDLFDQSLIDRAESLLPSASRVVERQPSAALAEDDEIAVYTLKAERDGGFRLDQGTMEALNCRDLELALWTLGGLAREYVAFHSSTGIFVRGAAVLHEGRIIVVIGPPLSGRTTLLAELVKAGASPWSDEYVVFNEDGQVGQFGVPSQSAATGRGSDFAPLGMVIITSFRPGVDWNPTTVSHGDSLLAMLAQAIPARERSAQTMSVLRKAVEGAVTLGGDRGDAASAAEAILAAAKNMFASGPLSG